MHKALRQDIWSSAILIKRVTQSTLINDRPYSPISLFPPLPLSLASWNSSDRGFPPNCLINKRTDVFVCMAFGENFIVSNPNMRVETFFIIAIARRHNLSLSRSCCHFVPTHDTLIDYLQQTFSACRNLERSSLIQNIKFIILDYD